MCEPGSATRLSYFWKLLASNFLWKVSQIGGKCLGHFENCLLLSKNRLWITFWKNWATFWKNGTLWLVPILDITHDALSVEENTFYSIGPWFRRGIRVQGHWHNSTTGQSHLNPEIRRGRRWRQWWILFGFGTWNTFIHLKFKFHISLSLCIFSIISLTLYFHSYWRT